MTPWKSIPSGEEILKSKKSYAIVGASNEMLKYGYELVCVFKDYGIKIFPTCLPAGRSIQNMMRLMV